jgi:hypothetical protein
MEELGRAVIDTSLATFRQYRKGAEAAAAQVGDDAFFTALGGEENSIATIMKHVGGNLRSRFTDFLTTDGEKPDRDRDAEFEHLGESRADVERIWREGWEAVLGALEALQPGDLLRTITIRGEPHSVIAAIGRSMTHTAYHVGQIALLAKHFAGGEWKTLSIPRRQSEAFTAQMQEQFARPSGSA